MVLVDLRILQCRRRSVGPFHFDGVYLVAFSQTEMGDGGALGLEGIARDDRFNAPHAIGKQSDIGADRGGVFGAFLQADADPVVSSGQLIDEYGKPSRVLFGVVVIGLILGLPSRFTSSEMTMRLSWTSATPARKETLA